MIPTVVDKNLHCRSFSTSAGQSQDRKALPPPYYTLCFLYPFPLTRRGTWTTVKSCSPFKPIPTWWRVKTRSWMTCVLLFRYSYIACMYCTYIATVHCMNSGCSYCGPTYTSCGYRISSNKRHTSNSSRPRIVTARIVS